AKIALLVALDGDGVAVGLPSVVLDGQLGPGIREVGPGHNATAVVIDDVLAHRLGEPGVAQLTVRPQLADALRIFWLVLPLVEQDAEELDSTPPTGTEFVDAGEDGSHCRKSGCKRLIERPHEAAPWDDGGR